ncbi:hypothetical protein FBEOM_14742, partial [Fusarium beomiforme]
KEDKERRARRCALYESGNHKCEPIPNLAEPLVRVLKMAIQSDKEAKISNARIALRLQLDTWADKETRGFFTKADLGSKPLITIGDAAEQELACAGDDDGGGEGGEADASDKELARKLIRILKAVV